ncbi:hypothetical protein DUNSADRAFT_5687 [Dunaliella salina]|uniref:LAGLIDADG homing endonuclease n=1 Tax=Dunaliella salina TaxID=3046 RepID=A0ABQ7GPS7_DUNSA|nr:hypothetical protein DUNSADRAFT_5687 [Dunaliella salina]|eukprot:KAF5836612.1 hypothetical protein DUNSADRAFT_5687 [Dunaliella salina]
MIFWHKTEFVLNALAGSMYRLVLCHASLELDQPPAAKSSWISAGISGENHVLQDHSKKMLVINIVLRPVCSDLWALATFSKHGNTCSNGQVHFSNPSFRRALSQFWGELHYVACSRPWIRLSRY